MYSMLFVPLYIYQKIISFKKSYFHQFWEFTYKNVGMNKILFLWSSSKVFTKSWRYFFIRKHLKLEVNTRVFIILFYINRKTQVFASFGCTGIKDDVMNIMNRCYVWFLIFFEKYFVMLTDYFLSPARSLLYH